MLMQQQMARDLDIPESSRELYTAAQLEVDLGVQSMSKGNAAVAVMSFESALQKIGAGQPFHAHLVHNLLVSYKLMIDQRLAAGDMKGAESILERVLQLDMSGEVASDQGFLQQLAGIVDAIGLTFSKYRNFEVSLRCVRKAISIHPSPGLQVNLENALRASGQSALLSDFTAEVTKEELGRHILIACVPKSGSTFLKNVLLSLSGYRDAFMVYTPSQFEQDLYLPTVVHVARADTVTQQHLRASDANVQIMQGFEIRPIVLVRNIFDAVISLMDFYDGGASSNTFFRADYRSLDESTKIDLLIDNLVPWYFQFAASWSFVQERKSLDIFWLSYEELINDKPATIASVLKFYGLGAPLRGIEQRIREIESEKRRTRFNKGVAGRGNARLSQSQKDRIRSYARYFPTTDFSRIGL